MRHRTGPSLTDYLIFFLIVLGVNMLPAFGPPTWSIIVFFSFNTQMPVPALVLVGAVAAAAGRLALAYGFRYFAGYLPRKYRDNLGAARVALEAKRRNAMLALGLFALSPLPSAQLFAAAGLSGVRLLGFTLAFFAGRLVSYSIYAFSAKRIRETSFGDLFGSSFSSGWGIALQIATLCLLVLFVRIDWRRVLGAGPDPASAEPPRR